MDDGHEGMDHRSIHIPGCQSPPSLLQSIGSFRSAGLVWVGSQLCLSFSFIMV
uniref:Uncharacterized protein n=1 Tax=Arundo donax TaxID=35708 RepID=A0A0A9GG54_ARUDO